MKKPETLRPWTPFEVPLGALVRSKLPHAAEGGCWTTIIGKSHDGDVLTFEHEPEDALTSCVKLFKNSEHSVDNGKTWLPCGVEE